MDKYRILNNINIIENILIKKKFKDNLKKYNSGEVVHEKQLLFHKNQKKNRWVFGGNRSGKTECGAVEAIWIARGIHPFRENKKNTEGWVVSVSSQVQRDVAQSKILHYLNKEWIHDIIMKSGKKESCEFGIIDCIIIKNVFGGFSKIGFKSCDQGREKFQGSSLDWVWFDEEPPLDIYLECRMRILDKCGDIFGTMTPLKGLTWVYEYIYLNEFNDPDIWYEQMEWSDNPFLNKDEIKKFSASLSKDELNSRRFGLFQSACGRVYTEFDENINVIEPFVVPKEWFDNISIDPGLNNPLSCHWYAVDYDNNIYVIEELYEAGKPVEYHAKNIKEVCNRLGWKKNYNGMISALIDSAAGQRVLSSEKSVAELFYDNGILVNTHVNKDLFTGINRVKSYLKNVDGKSKLFIFKNCTNLIREIKNYYWGSNDVPIKKDDHALDELRYYIMNRPENKEPKKEKSEIQKNKERLYRELKFNRGNNGW